MLIQRTFFLKDTVLFEGYIQEQEERDVLC